MKTACSIHVTIPKITIGGFRIHVLTRVRSYKLQVSNIVLRFTLLHTFKCIRRYNIHVQCTKNAFHTVVQYLI